MCLGVDFFYSVQKRKVFVGSLDGDTLDCHGTVHDEDNTSARGDGVVIKEGL